MKIRSIINYIVLVIPLFLAIIGLQDEQFYIYALSFTAVTGGIQVLLALTMLFKYPGNLLYIYFGVTVFFFLIWMVLGSDHSYIFALPPALALFLTYIIFIESQKEKIVKQP